MYNPCVPCALSPNVPNHFHRNNVPNREIEEIHEEPCVNDRRMSPLTRTLEEYPNENYARINMMRKDSFFNPRPSISFINGFNGFKEWVTCLVLGTNKRKKNSKIIFKDKKSITNVFIAQKSQSLTGQRLSSFGDYAAITVNRTSKANSAAVLGNGEVEENDNEDGVKENGKAVHVKEVTAHKKDLAVHKKEMPALKNDMAVHKGDMATHKNDVKESNGNAEHRDVQAKVRHRKKRPAPLPPVQYPRMSNGIEASVTLKKESATSKSGVVKESQTRYKIVRSSSFRIHAMPQRRRRKKRRAPPPPPIHNSAGSEKTNGTVAALNSIPGSSTDNKLYEKREEKHKRSEERSLRKSNLKRSKNKVMYQHVKNGLFVNGYSDSGEESGSDDPKESSNSVSFSEDDSDNDKYGLVKYGIINKINSSEGSLNLPGTSNFIQYAGENSDVCLKISIQKTETNVVTVEEVSTPCSTTHYTIEEDSSSSELSDVPVVKQAERKAIAYEEPKLNSADSSSISNAEETADKSKTIFEELQMQPPVKGSVKDFVNAFNMLANKSSTPAIEAKKLNATTNLPLPKTQQSIYTDPTEGRNKSKDSQSMPTKWEYQNKIYASNNFLLPIAEESHNEASEHDGNDESKSPLIKAKNLSSSKTSPEMNDKKCSHCYEAHTQSSSGNNSLSKSLKKRIAPHKDSIVYDSSRPIRRDLSSQASAAALSSLLQEKGSSGTKEGKSKSSSTKNNAKLDQPIMVGLYIEDKSSHRGPIPLLVTPSMSLKKLKKQIEKEYEFPRHQQCWILGESFAVADEASLASYGVTEPGCPILLYVMSKDSKSHSLPARTTSLRVRANPQQDSSDSSEEEAEVRSKVHRKSGSKGKHDLYADVVKDVRKQTGLFGAIPKTDKTRQIPAKLPPRPSSRKRGDGKSRKSKSEFHKAWEAEFEKKADYHSLLALDDVDLVSNVEKFECPVCFLDVEVGEGATLQECLHSFCKECLAGAIQFSETAVVKCPFRNDEYSCECHLQEREVKSLVSPEVYERHLQRSMALAESQAQDSFHCKTPDCPGWCLFEDNVNTFLCPVCKHTNCLTCAAIHEGKNCRQYQDDVAFRCDSSEEARKTKEYLQNMVDNGEAMRCPKCQVIMMKKWGCDWLKCSMCHTEVCWVTKGPRWGPGGRGDTSGGCKCMVNGARCHPKCSYCH